MLFCFIITYKKIYSTAHQKGTSMNRLIKMVLNYKENGEDIILKDIINRFECKIDNE